MGKGNVDAIDFLNLRSMLKLRVLEVDPTRRKQRNFLWDPVQVMCKHLVRSKPMHIIRNLLLFLDLVLICFDAEDCQLRPDWPLNDTIMIVPLSAMTLIEIGEKSSFREFWSKSDWVDRLEYVCIAACALQVMPGLGVLFDGMPRISAIRLLRLVRWSTNLRRYGESFVQVFPILVQTVSFSVVITYLFAAIGAEFFHIDDRFSTFGSAFSTMIQLSFAVDFSDTVASVVNAGTDMVFTITAEIFFLLYFIIAVMLVMNLVSALMIEFYNCSLTDRCEAARSSFESKLQQVAQTAPTQQSHADSAVASFVVDALGNASKKEAWRLQASSNSSLEDLRREMGSGDSGSIDDADLKACQKYAKVNLLQLKERNQNGIESHGNQIESSDGTSPNQGVSRMPCSAKELDELLTKQEIDKLVALTQKQN